jgi:phage shock protein PspC (stress-responsive transcriptional regulator)
VGDRLYRSQHDRVIAGVAGGIAAWVRVDPSLVRVAWVLAAIFSGGIFVLIYIVMMIVVPLAPDGWTPPPTMRATPGGDAVPGWGQPGTGPGPEPGGPGPGLPGPGASGPGASGAPAGSAGTPSWPAGPPPATWDGTATARGARLVAGTVLVLLGLWLLLGQYVDIDWNLVWPLVVMGAGVLLIAAAQRRRSR